MSDKNQKVQTVSMMGGMYTLFSILIPGLLLVSIDCVLRDVLFFLSDIPWWFIFIVLVCTIVVSRVLILIAKKRSDISSLIRINFFIYVPAAGVMVIFLYETPLLIIYECILLLVQWIISYFIFNRFIDYVEFVKFVKNNPGRFLIAKIHTHALMIQNSYNSLKKLRKIVNVLQFLLFLLVTVLLLIGMQVRILSFIFCIGSIVTGLMFSITINTFMDEYRFYIDGFPLGEKLKQKRLAHILIFIILGVLCVLPLLRNSSLFSPGDIARAFKWFLHLFPEYTAPDSAIPVEYFGRNRGERTEIHEFFRMAQEMEPAINLALFFEILGIIILCFLGAGLLYFLFKPLFKKSFLQWIKGVRPLKEITKGIKRAVSGLQKFIREFTRTILFLLRPAKKKQIPVSTEKKQGPGLQPKKVSVKKRIQKNRVLKAFILLIKWGMKQKINFHPTLGPKEYVSIMIERIPEIKDILEFIADTFEEVVFSDHIMKALTIKKYLHDIKKIVRL